MTPLEINAKIAELCGHKLIGGNWPNLAEREDGTPYVTPNYHGSLDDCAGFEATLTVREQGIYLGHLHSICGAFIWPSVTATAPQRCEAFLRVKGIL